MHVFVLQINYNCTSCIKINKTTEYLRYSKIFLNCLLSVWITRYFGSQTCGLHLQTYIGKWLFLKWISHIHLSFSQHFLNTCHAKESGFLSWRQRGDTEGFQLVRDKIMLESIMENGLRIRARRSVKNLEAFPDHYSTCLVKSYHCLNCINVISTTRF